MKGRNLSGLEVTPAMIHVRHATKIASEVTEGELTPDLIYLSPVCNDTKTVKSPNYRLSFFPLLFFNLNSLFLFP